MSRRPKCGDLYCLRYGDKTTDDQVVKRRGYIVKNTVFLQEKHGFLQFHAEGPTAHWFDDVDDLKALLEQRLRLEVKARSEAFHSAAMKLTELRELKPREKDTQRARKLQAARLITFINDDVAPTE